MTTQGGVVGRTGICGVARAGASTWVGSSSAIDSSKSDAGSRVIIDYRVILPLASFITMVSGGSKALDHVRWPTWYGVIFTPRVARVRALAGGVSPRPLID